MESACFPQDAVNAAFKNRTAATFRLCERTIEPVQAPHLVLRDQLAPRQGCIQVHDGLRVHGVHETQSVADFVSCHMDKIRQPNPCNTDRPTDDYFLSHSPRRRVQGLFNVSSVIKRDAFLPAKAHVSQNPVLMVIEVDLSGLWKECMSQFSCDAIETMVQVGLEAVGVVVGIEPYQNRKTKALVRARAASFRLQLRNDGLLGHLVPGRT